MAQKKISDLTEKLTFDTDDILEIETAAGVSRKVTGLTLFSAGVIDLIYPVGCFYTQYPDAASSTEATAFPTAYSPATLFGGTWVSQFDTENIFFRTAGTDYQTRTNGLSADEFQAFQVGAAADGTGALDYYARVVNRNSLQNDTAGASANYGSLFANTTFQGGANMLKAMSDGTNGTPRTGAVTEPRNRLFKIWKRTA